MPFQQGMMARDSRHGDCLKKSDGERVGAIAMLFALLIAMGSGMGIGSFLYSRSQPAIPPAIDRPQDQSRSDIQNLVFDIRQQIDFNPNAWSGGIPAADEARPAPAFKALPPPRNVRPPVAEPARTEARRLPASPAKGLL